MGDPDHLRRLARASFADGLALDLDGAQYFRLGHRIRDLVCVAASSEAEAQHITRHHLFKERDRGGHGSD